MVAHSSIAAQNGTPNSPRVIMTNNIGNTVPGEQGLKMMMSFNGGEAYMNNSQSIEMAFVNPKNKEVEYFDLSFLENKSPHLSGKNPESCMSCHGEYGKEPKGGAKMIFDPFGNWPRFVGGADKCNPTEDKIQELVSDRALSSLNSNKQFECLDLAKMKKQGSQFSNGNIGGFDNAAAIHMENQRARWMASLPQYDRYKYYLAGAQVCQITKLSDWIPQSIIRKNIKNLDVDASLKKEGPFSDVIEEALQDE